MLRVAGRESERAEFRPASLVYRPALFAVEKMLPFTISGADRSSRRGGTCRLHATFMNQLLTSGGIRRNCQERRFACEGTIVHSTRPPHTFNDKTVGSLRRNPATVKPPCNQTERVLIASVGYRTADPKAAARLPSTVSDPLVPRGPRLPLAAEHRNGSCPCCPLST